MKSGSVGEVGVWQRLEADVTLLVNRNNCINWMDYFLCYIAWEKGGTTFLQCGRGGGVIGEEGVKYDEKSLLVYWQRLKFKKHCTQIYLHSFHL